VPTDPVTALYLALITAETGENVDVWWHLEPAGYFFELSNREGAIELHVLYSEDSSKTRKVRVASMVGGKKEVLLPLWRALRGFESMKIQEEDWPSVRLEGLERLGERLKKEKTQ
jgi:hypothetical protein